MKSKALSCVCVVLLLWSAYDDVLAAQTPELDDDIAAALDNDYVQCDSLSVQVEMQHAVWGAKCHLLAIPATAPPKARICTSRGISNQFPDPLYQFMSLQL
jgi:hypothetical protein